MLNTLEASKDVARMTNILRNVMYFFEHDGVFEYCIVLSIVEHAIILHFNFVNQPRVNAIKSEFIL